MSSSSNATSVESGMRDLRDEILKKDKDGALTYRDAAMFIMNSLVEVQKKIGMNPLMEPVLENATKVVQQELNKQLGSAARNYSTTDTLPKQYAKLMIEKFKE